MAQGGAARFHPPWQARRERADRIVQRAATRRVSERHRVRVARACSSDTDSLAGRLQSPPAARLTWPSDPKRVREPRSDQPAFAAPGSTLELSQNGGTLNTSRLVSPRCQRFRGNFAVRLSERLGPFAAFKGFGASA